MIHGTGHICSGIPARFFFNGTRKFANLAPVVFRSYSTHRNDRVTIVDFSPEFQDQNFNLSRELDGMKRRLQQKRVKLAELHSKADQLEKGGQYSKAAAIHEKVLIEGNSVSYFNSAIKAARLYRLAGEPEKASKYVKMVEATTQDGSFSEYLEGEELERQNRYKEASDHYRKAYEDALAKNLAYKLV